MQREAHGRTVRLAAESDLDDWICICKNVHGYARSNELRTAIVNQTAIEVELQGRMTGYSTILGFMVRAVAETNDDIKDLIGAAPEYAGPGFLVPTRNHDLFRWCLEQGLRVGYMLNLMSVGLYNEPCGSFLPSAIC